MSNGEKYPILAEMELRSVDFSLREPNSDLELPGSPIVSKAHIKKRERVVENTHFTEPGAEQELQNRRGHFWNKYDDADIPEYARQKRSRNGANSPFNWKTRPWTPYEAGAIPPEVP